MATRTARLVFMTTLFTIFILFFGYPSYIKYRNKETLISEKMVPYNWETPPAITVVAWRTNIEKGWRVDSYNQSLRKSCSNEFENFSKLIECIDRKTFNLSEIVEQVTYGEDSSINLSWSEDLDNFDLGKAFSINNSFQIGRDSNNFKITFKKGLNYTIYIHDANYYMYAHNPNTVPKIHIEVDSPHTTFAYITAVYHVNLDNKEENHCEDSESYSFTACIKNSLSRMVGCRLPWDTWSSTTIPVCRTSEQITRFEQMYEMIDTWEKLSIVNLTGCHPPCMYTQYKMTDSLKVGETPGISLLLSDSMVRKRTEKLIYPIESFVSEFGGALGLFLGFSFIMIFDLLAAVIAKLNSKFNFNLNSN